MYGPPADLPLSENAPLNPKSPYALSKRYIEQLANQYHQQYGLDTIALRYFNIVDSRQDPGGEYTAVIPKYIELMSQGEQPVIYGEGEQSRDFIYVSDVVDANLQAARSDCSDLVCNVARGERRTITELVGALNTVLETDLEPRYEEARAGDIRHSGADISTAKEAIGFEPTVAFEKGLARTVRSLS